MKYFCYVTLVSTVVSRKKGPWVVHLTLGSAAKVISCSVCKAVSPQTQACFSVENPYLQCLHYRWTLFQISFRPQQEIEENWGMGRQSIVGSLS